MKYIVLSFDDARSDTYDIAKPIMDKYGLKATVNVITDFVFHPSNFHFTTAPNPMTQEQLLDWQKCGGEIACHGSTHQNSVQDIRKNINELKTIAIDVSSIGFASPESWLTEKNLESSGIYELKETGELAYLRSGVQIRREGYLYTFLSVIEQFTHSEILYYFLNRKNILHKGLQYKILQSTAIKNFTTVKQVRAFIEHIPDGDTAILMFHSILEKGNPLYGKDHYYWDADRFDQLCQWISENKEIDVINTKEIPMFLMKE